MAVRHVWITGARPAEAARGYAPDREIGCHRRLRGPYTGLGTLLRAIVPDVFASDPGLVRAHAVEILSAAPELEHLIGAVPGTLTDTAPRQERTRWYSKLRTRRIAHGLVDLLRTIHTRRPATVAFTDVDEADATDLEFLALAVTRLDPAVLRVVVCSATADLDRGDAGHALRTALASRSQHVTADAPAAPATPTGAAAFIDADGIGDEPEEYRNLDPEVRARMHDARADLLVAEGEQSRRYGAIPYHRALGATGAERYPVFRDAINYCMAMAFYDAGLELAARLLELVDADTEPGLYHEAQLFRANLLVLLQRPDEVEPIYFDLLARTEDPAVHMTTAYAIAMLYTRMYAAPQKDHNRAKAWVNTAVALASQTPDETERAFRLAFMFNAKALVEMHLGRLDESLRQVDKGIELMRRGLPETVHHLHRSVLRHNRAQVYAALGRHDEALAEYDHIVSIDPAYPEFRFDRGNLLSKMGRYSEALADYETASRLGPPFPELYYNIGDLRATIGDRPGAIRDLAYVLDLEPDHRDARVALASVLLDSGEPEAAAAEARAGLAVVPDEPRLHCTLAIALIALDRPHEARLACDAALELDPRMAEALTNRAVAGYALGRYDDAVADLTAAHALHPDNPDILYNRGYAHQAAGRPAEAIDDYGRALRLPGADRAETLYQRALCHLAAGDAEAAHEDLDAHLALGPSPYQLEIDLLARR